MGQGPRKAAASTALVAEPIRRMWAGERDEASLTEGLHEGDTLIVRHILARLEQDSP